MVAGCTGSLVAASSHVELYGGLGVCLMACVSWFMSSRIEWFLRTFVQSPIMRGHYARIWLTESQAGKKGLRTIAVIQALAGVILILVSYLI